MNCSRSDGRSEEHTSELQSRRDLVCRLLLDKKKIEQTDLTHPDNSTSPRRLAGWAEAYELPHAPQNLCGPVETMANICFAVSTFFFIDPAPTKIYTLSLHDALPI